MSVIKYQLNITALAQDDLCDILQYEKMLSIAFKKITQNPDVGRKKDTLRLYVVGRHTIYYAMDKMTIYIIRILHQRMDTAKHLDNH
jgi:plasmid stabilization system protein ParE